MSKKVSKKAQILKLLKDGKSIGEVAKAIKVKPGYVYYIRWMDLNKSGAKASKKKAKKPSKILKAVKEADRALKAIKQRDRELASVHTLDFKLIKGIDAVNHPPHYRAGGIETIDFIEAKDLNYRLGNVVKYVSRAGKKLGADPVQDLEKAAFYLKREIEARKNA